MAKAKSKSSARARKALTVGGVSEPIQTVQQRLIAMTAPKPEGTSGRSSFKKAKKKSHITPEGRAQLSAAMKARWAAKRAAAAPPQQNSQGQTSMPEQASQQ